MVFKKQRQDIMEKVYFPTKNISTTIPEEYFTDQGIAINYILPSFEFLTHEEGE